ncbi:diguanylate cyclase domain-containing protein [Zoogloea sp.]|uniref:sensor domain-containing diguanylate cyclase n=1 Tax=Zoogloea sp. TaxID=49181 RepID=UPI0035AF266C
MKKTMGTLKDRARAALKPLSGSLRMRVALGLLLGVMVALWLTTLALMYFLKQEMLATLAAQQYSVVSLLANDIDRSVTERIRALEGVAATLDAKTMEQPARLDASVRGQTVLLTLFNWGVLVTDRKGTTLVGLPEAHGRQGVNYADVEAVRETLETGRTTVGAALLGKTTHQPVVPMIVPIRDGNGQVIGSLIGLTNLAASNFLDEIGANRFGRQGGYLITDPAQRIFIAATDKTRVMQPGPPVGVNPVYDRYIDGHEGSGVARSSRGVVELSSSRKVRSTGWLMQSVLPADEAFAPFYALRWRLLASALILSVLAGGMGWWWLRRELRPLGEAVDMLGAMRDGVIPRQPLPVRRDDEIGALAGAFNGLLQGLIEGEARAAEHSFNQRLRVIVSQIPGVVFQYRIGADGRHSLPFVSDAAREVWGLAPDGLAEAADGFLVTLEGEDRVAFLTSLFASACTLGPWHLECRIQHPRRGVRWMHMDGIPEAAADGSLTWQGFAMDITDAKDAESELRIAAATFETQEGIFITDARTRIVRVNQAFTTMTGYTAREAIGQTPRLLRSGRHDAEFYGRLREGLARNGFWQGEIWNRRKGGEVFAEWVTISTVRDRSGEVTHYVAAFSDITEHKRAEEQIEQLAFYDPLTRLPNRRLFHDRFDQALAASARNNTRGALMFLDLDGFKCLNDQHGHVMGDALLAEVARRLTASIRETDTVARLGGDEFVVVLESLDEGRSAAAAHAGRVAEKLREALARPYLLVLPTGGAEVSHHCTASIGVSLFNGHGESRDELLKQADIAMYRAKSAGRNAICFFGDHTASAPGSVGGCPQSTGSA